MSGFEVASVVLSVIPLLKSTLNVFKNVPKGTKLSETLEDVRFRLPVILDTLQACIKHLNQAERSIHPRTSESMEETLNYCYSDVLALREELDQVISGDGNVLKGYLKLDPSGDKAKRIEKLMLSIARNVEKSASIISIQLKTPGANAALNETIKKMMFEVSSVPEGELASLGNNFNSGDGARANQEIVVSGGQRLENNNEDAHARKSSLDQEYDLSYKGRVGVHLNQAPHIPPASFQARGLEMCQMENILKPHDNTSINRRLLVIGGKPGIGKTQLAIAYAKRHSENYESIFWLDAASEATLRRSLRSIAQLILDVQQPKVIEDEEIAIRTLGWLSHSKNTRWLLIFDNYDDPGQFEIEKYYPTVTHGSIVITTRQPDLVTGRTLYVGPLQITAVGIQALGLSLAILPFIADHLDEIVLEGIVENEEIMVELISNPQSEKWEDSRLKGQIRTKLGRHYDVVRESTTRLWERLDQLFRRMEIGSNTRKPISTEISNIRLFQKVLSKAVYDDLSAEMNSTISILKNYLEISTPKRILSSKSPDVEGVEIKFKEEDRRPCPESDPESRTDETSTQTFSSVQRGTNNFTEDTSLAHESGAPGDSKSRIDENYTENNAGLYDSQTQYSASEISSLPPPEDSGYMISLARELFDAVSSFQPNEQTMKYIAGILPDLLRAFALKIGHKAGTRMQLDVSFFVHRYRSRIQGFFEDMLPLEIDPELACERIESRQFVLDRFLMEPEIAQAIPGEIPCLISPEPEHYDEVFEDDVESEPDTGPYRNFILGTSAYRWLIATLQKEAIMTRSNPDIMHEIGKGILKALPSSHTVSRRRPAKEYRGIFELDWDPLSFLMEQQATDPPHEAVKKAITLTGAASDGQAITTGAYLSQTWPATGDVVMQLVVDVLKYTNHQATAKLPDGTYVDVETRDGKFIVRVSGTGDSLAEFAQQFAWLGSALRPSNLDYGVVSCTPFIQSSRLNNTSTSAVSPGVLPVPDILCVIGFKMESFPREEKLPGQCWHAMFRNPVVVKGYPILTKKRHDLGLEMPLNMMAGLTDSDRAIEFDGKVFIKGFSAMLVATKIVEDLLVWHYFYNSDGSRISYLDQSLQNVEKISLMQLETSRHVVGWCADCKYNAGAENAQYDIGGTGLPRPHAGCMLDKVSFSGGKIITGGVSLSIFLRDQPLHLTRNGYISKLQWIYTRYVVLWDEKDKRGWLVNGISALLHLVRASLRHYSKDDFSSAFLFDFDKMTNSKDFKPNSAINVLIHEGNKELEIYPGKSERSEEEEMSSENNNTGGSKTQKKKRGYYLFEDLVEQHFTILEQIIEYHAKKAGENGVNLKLRARKHLEGWDFAELATGHDPRPRVATLEAMGWGWVDFIRSIGAVTLFGRDFGEIIQPVEFNGLCPGWKRLPTQKYYLAASVREMRDIVEKYGNGWNDPHASIDNLLWHSPNGLVTS
ncbi:hypothetical protein N7456_002492 [Penicillium angulare]|uniref:NB-ARC domain-containing protein n=1 Tax=Penicillium angulare TaxID=116970 RepID=A0A9W9G8S6_9EURO|nr:hypothetical protein N7456_002492 [Penicillium angulare]